MLTESEYAAISFAIERARRNPIPWQTLRELLMGDATERPQSEVVRLPGNHVLCLSFEEQPIGTCLHISISVDCHIPGPVAIALIADACGLVPQTSEVWQEEFIDSDNGKIGIAFNIVGIAPIVGHA